MVANSRDSLSPCSGAFQRVLQRFDDVLNRSASLADARAELAALALPGALVNGFAHGQPGLREVVA